MGDVVEVIIGVSGPLIVGLCSIIAAMQYRGNQRQTSHDSDISGKLGQLSTQVTNARSDISNMRAEMTQLHTRDQQLAERLAKVEERVQR